MSNLRLVKSCSEAFRSSQNDIVLNLAEDPKWKGLMRLFPRNHEFDPFEYQNIVANHISECKERIHFLLEKSGVDYTLEISGMRARLRFNNQHDSQVGFSHLFPEQMVDFEFLKYPDDVPDDYLERVAATLQERYDSVVPKKSKLNAPVILRADFATHAIRARTIGADMIRIMEHGRHFGQLLNAPRNEA